MCGIWEDFAVGIFGALASTEQFVSQLIGVGAYAGACIVASILIIGGLKKITGIRVSEKEEIQGLDIHEHGMSAILNSNIN